MMKAHVIAALEGMGKPPTSLYHLRIWGCEWIGRGPTSDIGMVFWLNTYLGRWIKGRCNGEHFVCIGHQCV